MKCERLKINDVKFFRKKLEFKKLEDVKERRYKKILNIKSEINEIENKDIRGELTKLNWFFEKMKKIKIDNIDLNKKDKKLILEIKKVLCL